MIQVCLVGIGKTGKGAVFMKLIMAIVHDEDSQPIVRELTDLESPNCVHPEAF